jgi:hypothetical protein
VSSAWAQRAQKLGYVHGRSRAYELSMPYCSLLAIVFSCSCCWTTPLASGRTPLAAGPAAVLTSDPPHPQYVGTCARRAAVCLLISPADVRLGAIASSADNLARMC